MQGGWRQPPTPPQRPLLPLTSLITSSSFSSYESRPFTMDFLNLKRKRASQPHCEKIPAQEMTRAFLSPLDSEEW